MGIPINERAYRKLIDEDIAAIEKNMTDSLEREHIIDVLKWSIDQIYGAKENISDENGGLHKHVVMPPLLFNFKLTRKNKGLTLRQVEESTGISNAYLSQLENGKIKSPSYNTIRKLVSFYRNGA